MEPSTARVRRRRVVAVELAVVIVESVGTSIGLILPARLSRDGFDCCDAGVLVVVTWLVGQRGRVRYIPDAQCSPVTVCGVSSSTATSIEQPRQRALITGGSERGYGGGVSGRLTNCRL
eukprot:6212039-Pleurochrysis_carterae.AAC.1